MPHPDPSLDPRPWFERAFGPDYPLVYAHRDQAAARAEVAFLSAQGLAAPVLDLACGSGRHLEALAELGVQAFGLDLSPSQLAVCPLPGRALRADFRRLPLAAGRLGTVLSLFTSFGYLAGPEEDAQVLAEVARVLAPGGCLYLDVPRPGPLRRGLVPLSETRRGELLIRERRRLTQGGRRVEKRVEVRGPEGVRSWHEDVALYEPEQLAELLASAGLRLEAAWGSLAGAPATADSPRQILRARAD
jgi:dTDP-3-amino-3,6-dideoxy-alpha-D-glucopyranose N,N-dimethyltransferase/dTDP-3-amino-3,4,6-trideoxy-alpha-D-glucopyranose N,N-dimethyltransferase